MKGIYKALKPKELLPTLLVESDDEASAEWYDVDDGSEYVESPREGISKVWFSEHPPLLSSCLCSRETTSLSVGGAFVLVWYIFGYVWYCINDTVDDFYCFFGILRLGTLMVPTF